MIKVGYCVAYDWELLRFSIPQIYEHADVICLSVDQNRQSWTGELFSWDETGFRAMINELDPDKKIHVYEDRFYNPSLQPMQNEVNQRNRIADYLGKGGWHVQLDADEYFLDFKSFARYLKAFRSNRKVNICCPMINLYKLLPEGILWIKPASFSEVEYFPVATLYPAYEHGRRNGYFNILTDHSILHQSWARSEREIWEKLNNWGHANDFDVNKYFNLWKEADRYTYSTYKDFHHLYPKTWPALALQPQISDISDLLNLTQTDFPLPITQNDLRRANALHLSRIKKLWNLIVK